MYCVLDIGGTNLRVGVSRDGAALQAIKIAPTPKRFTDGVALIQTFARQLTRDKKIKAVVAGMPGQIDQRSHRHSGAGNLPDWSGKPIAKTLSRLLHAPVLLENDALLAALGEAHRGAGRGYPIVGYLTVSTGLGGAKIVDGKPDANAFGFEPGAHIIESKKLQTLESLVSGAAVLRRHKKSAASLSGAAAWNELTRCLAMGIHNAIRFWSPDIMVIGGGLMKRIAMPRLQREVRNLFTQPRIPKIKKAALGDRAGLEGALIYLHQNFAVKKIDRP